jgi:hypothetical protein
MGEWNLKFSYAVWTKLSGKMEVNPSSVCFPVKAGKEREYDSKTGSFFNRLFKQRYVGGWRYYGKGCPINPIKGGQGIPDPVVNLVRFLLVNDSGFSS